MWKCVYGYEPEKVTYGRFPQLQRWLPLELTGKKPNMLPPSRRLLTDNEVFLRQRRKAKQWALYGFLGFDTEACNLQTRWNIHVKNRNCYGKGPHPTHS